MDLLSRQKGVKSLKGVTHNSLTCSIRQREVFLKKTYWYGLDMNWTPGRYIETHNFYKTCTNKNTIKLDEKE